MGLFHPVGRINPMSRINPTMLRQIESVPALGAFIPSLVDCFTSAQADHALAERGYVRTKCSRRSSRGPATMRKQNKQHAVESIFSDNPFVDDFMDWMGSPEGQQSIEIDDTLWEALKKRAARRQTAQAHMA